MTPVCLAPKPRPFTGHPSSRSSLQTSASSDSVSPLELFWRFRADSALTNSVCSFVYNFMTFLYIPTLQTFWLSYSLSMVFHVLWVLVTFTKVQTVPFPPPLFSLLLIKSYVQTKGTESCLSWPVEYIHWFLC